MSRSLLYSLMIICLSFSLNAKTSEKQKLCKTPSGRIVDCKLLEEAKQLLAIKKAKEENEKLKAEIEAQKKSSKNETPLYIEQDVVREADVLSTEKSNPLHETLEPKTYSPQTSTNIPEPKQELEQTVSTNISKEEGNSFSRDFAAAIENNTAQPLKNDTDPLYNNFKLIMKYNLTDLVNLKTEPSVSWKWTNNTDNSTAFMFNDFPISINHNSFYYSKSLQTTFSGAFVISLPTGKWSRQAGVISYLIANVVSKTDINNYKGSITITPEISGAIRRYSTAAPTATDQESFNKLDPANRIAIGGGDQAYELLSPYDQLTISVNTSFWHKIVGGLSFSTWIKFINTKMYGDYVLSKGQIHTLKPESWINMMEFSQELKYEVSNKFSIKAGVASTGLLSGYRPFSTSDSNNVVCWLTLKYDFFNKTDF